MLVLKVRLFERDGVIHIVEHCLFHTTETAVFRGCGFQVVVVPSGVL